MTGAKRAQSDAPAPVTIRTALRPGDAAAVESLVRATGFFTPAEVAVARAVADEALAQGPGGGYAFVLADAADDADPLAGYACYGEIPAAEGRYDLYWIAVAPSHQRQGIGVRVLAEVEAHIARAGGRRIYIETSSQLIYAPTRAFYRAAGYLQEARLADFYRDGDDKLIFSKALS
jgi:ribosomal protein S18 acetylase RimI-like enzyme